MRIQNGSSLASRNKVQVGKFTPIKKAKQLTTKINRVGKNKSWEESKA
jgi:hypothetical protein